MSTTYLLRALNRAERKYSNIVGRESLKRTKEEWIDIALMELLEAYEEKIWEYDMEILKESYLNPQKKYNIEQCKLWHEKLPKEECKECEIMDCENKKEVNQD